MEHDQRHDADRGRDRDMRDRDMRDRDMRDRDMRNREMRERDTRDRDMRDRDREYGRDSDRGRSWDNDRSRDNRGRDSRDGDRGHDRDRGRSRDYGRPQPEDNMNEDRSKGNGDRSRIRGHESIDMFSDVTTPAVNSGEGDDSKAAKRSRWSNDPQGTSGLDDASHKLAKNTALEIAARFASLSKSAGENASAAKSKEPEPEPEVPAKPVIDITKANTEDTVSNVLGQLYDDDDDDDDDDEPPAPVSAPVKETKDVTETVVDIKPSDEIVKPSMNNGIIENTKEKSVNKNEISTDSNTDAPIEPEAGDQAS